MSSVLRWVWVVFSVLVHEPLQLVEDTKAGLVRSSSSYAWTTYCRRYRACIQKIQKWVRLVSSVLVYQYSKLVVNFSFTSLFSNNDYLSDKTVQYIDKMSDVQMMTRVGQ